MFDDFLKFHNRYIKQSVSIFAVPVIFFILCVQCLNESLLWLRLLVSFICDYISTYSVTSVLYTSLSLWLSVLGKCSYLHCMQRKIMHPCLHSAQLIQNSGDVRGVCGIRRIAAESGKIIVRDRVGVSVWVSFILYVAGRLRDSAAGE